MLGVLIFEREPLTLGDIPALLWVWVQAIGPFALLGMFLLVGVTLRFGKWSLGTLGGGDQLLPRKWMRPLILVCLLVCLVGTIARAYFLARASAAANLAGIATSNAVTFNLVASSIAGFVAGLAGLVGIGTPFLYGCLNLSWRRIWGLTRLSFMEGVRRRILYVFSALLVVLMFASWFISTKPEYQLATYVNLVALAMTPLLLFAANLVSAFSIPADIRQQTIQTVLTKPVERFEVVLGRFLGYVGLMTLILVVLNLVGVLYVLRGIDPEAAATSLKARVPWYGKLSFENIKDGTGARGESVGREWEYRSYISGPMGVEGPPALAVWSFPEPSSTLAGRDRVRCEFEFDIYRTTKGFENRGVLCSLTYTTWKFQKGNEAAARARLKELEDARDPDPVGKVAEEFGYYKVESKTVADYHTEFVEIPGGLFKNAIPKDAAERKEMAALAKDGIAPVAVRVQCLSATQYLGMAQPDLYLRLDDAEGGADRLWFSVNFFKSATGLWMQLCLVIGLAVCLSTNMTGVIAFLIGGVLFVGGYFRDFIQQVAFGANVGGGPLESLVRLTTRTTMNAPLEQTVTTNVAQSLDEGFRVLVRTVLNVIPDVSWFGMTDYVAAGFDIPFGQVVMNLLVLLGYLLPWFVLAYYLMKGREIAAAN